MSASVPAVLAVVSEHVEAVRAALIKAALDVDAQTNLSTHWATALDAVQDTAVNVIASEIPFPEYYLSLGGMIFMSTLVIYVGATRAVRSADQAIVGSPNIFGAMSGGRGGSGGEGLSMGDAASFPLVGSMTLFGLYCVLKYVPKEYVSAAMSVYLTLFASFALVMFLSEGFLGGTYKKGPNGVLNKILPRNMRIKKSSISIAIVSLTVVVMYFTRPNFLLNNILGCSLAVTAVQVSPVPTFPIGAVLLMGLFLYDIFWVFGTDVMVTVATSVDGPIKIVLPKNILTEFWGPATLLGLGDIIVPGFLITFMAHFSVYGSKAAEATKARLQEAMTKAKYANNVNVMNAADSSKKDTGCKQCGYRGLSKEEEKKAMEAEMALYAKRMTLLRREVRGGGGSYFYLYLCLVAYVASLVHTMYIMVVFQHAQPALLYIVPYVLVAILLGALVKGDLSALFSWTTEGVYTILDTADETAAKAKRCAQDEKEAAKEEVPEEGSAIWGAVKEFCGFE